jgi:hypothetical protein
LYIKTRPRESFIREYSLAGDFKKLFYGHPEHAVPVVRWRARHKMFDALEKYY